MVAKRREREWLVLWDAPEGHQDVEYTNDLEPRDIYNDNDITYDFETGKFSIGVRDWAATGTKMDLTWQDLRDVRDQDLNDTDAKVGQTDAPQAIQDAWIAYRQRLRDLPAWAQAQGYEPWQAVQMWPVMPKDMRDPDAASDPEDPYRDGAFAVDVAVAALKVAGKR